ncbi:DUF1194 domain-containing protein [Actibacterium sp. 188UL27-1]|nr:DUF1194 domain-containing protein [Actibacterium sp. 188UL27-1]
MAAQGQFAGRHVGGGFSGHCGLAYFCQEAWHKPGVVRRSPWRWMSRSVDGHEYRLQLDGVARALQAGAVQGALLTFPDRPVSIAVYEWSGIDHQVIIQDWWVIRNSVDIAAIARRLRSHRRQTAPAETALGAALLFGQALVDTAPGCARRTIDISGDGQNNIGLPPQSDAVHTALDDRQCSGHRQRPCRARRSAPGRYRRADSLFSYHGHSWPRYISAGGHRVHGL